SDVANSDHKVAMTGRSATADTIMPAPFSFRSSQSHASSQRGKAQIAPIVSGTQIRTRASTENRLKKTYRAGRIGDSGNGETASPLRARPSSSGDVAPTNMRNGLTNFGVVNTITNSHSPSLLGDSSGSASPISLSNNLWHSRADPE